MRTQKNQPAPGEAQVSAVLTAWLPGAARGCLSAGSPNAVPGAAGERGRRTRDGGERRGRLPSMVQLS